MNTFQAFFLLSYSLGHAPCLYAARIKNRVSIKDSETKFAPAKDPITESLVHRCVEARAKDFPFLLQRLSIDVPQNASDGTIVEHVDSIVEIKDLQDLRHSSRSTVSRMFHWDMFSSRDQEWKKQMALHEGELHRRGFDYEAAAKRCAKGANDESYECMQPDEAPNGEVAALRKQVRERIDIKDVLIHPVAGDPGLAAYSAGLLAAPLLYNKLWKRVYELDAELRDASYDWSSMKQECRGRMHTKAESIKKSTLTQLSKGETVKESGEPETCREIPNGMCPEGTFVTTKRRRDNLKGGAVLAVTYPTAKITLAPAGYAIGGALAGPMGAAVGGVVASSVGAGLAFAISYWASLGPEECSCFIRDCSYVPEVGGCRITTEDESPTKNPYGKALPMSGMKCELEYKSTDTCMMSQCDNADYAGLIEDQGFENNGINLFGKLGSDGAGTYNCLSKNGEPTGAVHLDTHLPEGAENTSPNRAKLFSTLHSSDKRFGKLEQVLFWFINQPGTI